MTYSLMECQARLSLLYLPLVSGTQKVKHRMKIKESRFQVHDELTAPERSVPVLKGALSSGGQLPNFLGVLAFLVFIAVVIGAAAGITWVVVKLSPPKHPEPPAQS